MKMEQTECSETSAYKIQTPENYPEGNIQQVVVTYYYTLRKNPVHYYYFKLKERVYLQGLQDPSQTNGDNPNNIRETSRYRVIKKSLCTWWLQYRKLQVMFKVSPASFQTFIDTPNCVLEDRVQYSTVHIANVFCEGHLQIINCVGIVIVRCTETFWSPCISYTEKDNFLR